MAAQKGSKALYGTKAANKNAAKKMKRQDAQVPFYEISSSAFDDGVTRTWTEDNPNYKPTRGGSKLPGTRARLQAAEEQLKKNGANNATRADVLRAAGAMAAGGKVQTSADTARKLATEMGGMKKGGKPKANGLAVMIAIGSPKKPMKKAGGGMACAKDGGMMKPVKRAQGGAGKVRKGMMTPEGKIIHAINKVRGN